MSSTLVECYRPVEMIAELDRLEVDDPPAPNDEDAVAELGMDDWDRVNQSVQEVLQKLAGRVRLLRPDVRSQTGSTAGKSFYLVTYRVFEVPSDHGILPVVVSVDFDPTSDGSGIEVKGDITAEETGEVFFETKARRVPKHRGVLLAASLRVARELVEQVDHVLENLVQACFPSGK